MQPPRPDLMGTLGTLGTFLPVLNHKNVFPGGEKQISGAYNDLKRSQGSPGSRRDLAKTNTCPIVRRTIRGGMLAGTRAPAPRPLFVTDGASRDAMHAGNGGRAETGGMVENSMSRVPEPARCVILLNSKFLETCQ
jgi:hypothetical protein